MAPVIRRYSKLFRLRHGGSGLSRFTISCVLELKPNLVFCQLYNYPSLVPLAQADADIARMLLMAPAKFALNPGFARNAFTDTRIAPRLRFLKTNWWAISATTLWVLMSTVGMVFVDQHAPMWPVCFWSAPTDADRNFRFEQRWEQDLDALRETCCSKACFWALRVACWGWRFADAALRVLVASELTHLLPRIHEIAIDPTVLAFTVGVSLAAGLLFGLIPIFKYARPHLLRRAAQRKADRLTESKDRHRARSLLVVVQVALALVLLVASA